MAWTTTNVSEERFRFVLLAEARIEDFSHLCKSFRISRVTGYRWLQRYRLFGNFHALKDMHRRPHFSPTKIRPEVEEEIVKLHSQSEWGIEKTLAHMEQKGIRISRSTIQRIVKRDGRSPKVAASSLDWMLELLLARDPLCTLQRELPNHSELPALATVLSSGRLRDRRKALAIVALLKGSPPRIISELLKISKQSLARYAQCYRLSGYNAVFPERKSRRRDSPEDKRLLFGTLHSPPSVYGINRTSWKLEDLRRTVRRLGRPMSYARMHRLIKEAGFRWRKARVVLTSTDPDYRTKLDRIRQILAALREDEAFFSIDEFGPFALKHKGGWRCVGPDENYVIPQWQRSKGWMIITAALDLAKNQVTHFYSLKKNTDEMIEMADLLRSRYRGYRTIYLSWDAASWHMSKKLFVQIDRMNQVGDGHPTVKTAPLPSGSQFLNVIESVFSGMARAIIHNSDYASVADAKRAVDVYFDQRNEYFKRFPRRAGNKLWGHERVVSEFSEGNNCKDPRY